MDGVMIMRIMIWVQAAVLILWSVGHAQMAQDFNRLTPEQQKAMELELGRTGMPLAPGTIEMFKTRSDQSNRPNRESSGTKEAPGGRERNVKGGLREPDMRRNPPTQGKGVYDKPQEPSFYERHRTRGKYQDISTNLKPFGYDFFRDAEVRIVSDRKDIPVPPTYVVGPGDEVKIVLWGRVNNELYLTVDRNGNVTIPQIGPIRVAGMTFEEMSAHLIKQAEQIVGAKVDITMGSGRTIPVFVLGDARRPGAYTIGSFATITDALLLAGGPSDIGSMRTIQLRRKGKTVTTFDLYELLLKGDKSKDLPLEAGDVVFIPVTGPVAGIAGNVKRPAIYELKDRHDLAVLFDLAGGVIPTAFTQHIQIERVVKNERQMVLDINARDLTRSKGTRLEDLDLVKVFNIVGKEENVVFLQGNVKRPGKYEYKPGMKLKDLLKSENELLPETYLDYAVLKRMEPPDFTSRMIPINLKEIFSTGHNPELKPQDSIVIFSKWFFKDKPYIIVEGEVRGNLEEPRRAGSPGVDEFGAGDGKDLTRLGRAEIDWDTFDELRKAGITRLDDPRLAEFRGTGSKAGGPAIDQRTIDELRRMGITSLDDPRLTLVRSQLWPGAREIDQRTIDELRRAGISSLDDPRIAQMKGDKGTGRPDIDQRTIDELRRSGIANLDDPRIAEMRGQSGTGRPEIDQRTVDELRRMGIASLDDPRIAELKTQTAPERVDQGRSDQARPDPLKPEIDQRTIDELRRMGITSLDDPRITEMRAQSGTRVDQRKFVRIPLTENMTVRDAILAAGGLGRDAYQIEAELYRTDDATRSVNLIRFNVKRVMEGEGKENLALKNHDRIVIHSVWGFNYKRTVAIDGEVLRPGTYPYAAEMTVKDLIFAAGNILEGAYLDGAEITSQIVESDKYVKLEHRNINLRKALEGDPLNNVSLRPYDRLNVKRLQDWRRERTVTVGGEVLFPGKYVVKKNERLSSVIERAGGYTDEAYLRGAIFTRSRVRAQQREALDEMVSRLERESLSASSSVAALSAEEIKAKETEVDQRMKFIEVLKKTRPNGRLTVYLANLRLLRGSEYDLELEEGDNLFIPTRDNVVVVAGAVMANGTFVRLENMGYEDYIRMAGGYSRYADESNAFVMKVDGGARKLGSGYVNWNPLKKRWESSWFSDASDTIEAGDTIIVPEKLDRTAWLRQFRDIAQIVGNIGLTAATVAVLYKTLKNN